jgi:adenylosuccinate lyase
MIGRTLGQHALPITFGKKVAVWAAMNRRNIERLKEVLARIETSGILKGAVGTHLGLGERGVEVEKRFAKTLGLEAPDPADWHGVRDVVAEYALALALISKSYAAIGGEVFRLQMTDIGEVIEVRPETAVGSSTMPHKSNPSRSEALVHAGRTIPRLAEVLLDDVENSFERDNTSRPNDVIEQISIEAARMMRDAQRLISSLEIDTTRMRANIDATDGMVMAQRIVLALADSIGREEVEERVRLAAERSIAEKTPFREALLADEILAPLLAERLDALLDPTTYIGLSATQVDRTNAAIARARRTDPAP